MNEFDLPPESVPPGPLIRLVHADASTEGIVFALRLPERLYGAR